MPCIGGARQMKNSDEVRTTKQMESSIAYLTVQVAKRISVHRIKKQLKIKLPI